MSLVTNFAFQWLKVDGMDKIKPDPVVFPYFDEDLRAAFHKEMELFVGSVLLQDHDVLDLLTANYTFVNERLALHYGIRNVRAASSAASTLTDSHRFGLARQGRDSDGHLLRQPHRAGAARRLGARGRSPAPRRMRRRRPSRR